MTFKRPDMGQIGFKWMLENPQTYTRPISNERIFVLTRTSRSWYACVEGSRVRGRLHINDVASMHLRDSITSCGLQSLSMTTSPLVWNASV